MIGSFAELAFGELPSAYDHSVPSPFQAILDDKDAQLVYLVHLYPFDPQIGMVSQGSPPFGSLAFGEFDLPLKGALTSVYLSDEGFTTTPNATLANIHFKALVDNPYQYDLSILSGDDFGAGASSYGSITILNGDGEMDNLTTYYWGARRALIKAGTKDLPYDLFTTVFDGSVNGIEVDDERTTLTIRDNRIKVDQYLSVPVYGGTGGLEGGTNIQGLVKPLCYGEVRNIEPVLVDATNLIYQVHDGSILSIDAVRDSGLALINDGDFANINTPTIPAGHYATQNSAGLIRLGSSPAGRVTMDVKGDNTGSYVSKTGAICQRIVKTRLGGNSLQDSEIDGGSFNVFDDVITGDVGIYVTEKATASSILDTLINSVLGFWAFNRTGYLTCGLIQPPDQVVMEIGEDGVDEPDIQIISEITPAFRITVGYEPLGVAQGADELAGAVSNTDRAYFNQEYRNVLTEDTTVYAQNPTAIEKTFETRLVNKADAQVLADRLKTIYSTGRRIYKVTLLYGLYKLFINDTVNLTNPRHGLSSGKKLRVVNLSEDAQTNKTTVELWG